MILNLAIVAAAIVAYVLIGIPVAFLFVRLNRPYTYSFEAEDSFVLSWSIWPIVLIFLLVVAPFAAARWVFEACTEMMWPHVMKAAGLRR